MHQTRYALPSRKIGLLASVAVTALGVVTTAAFAFDPDNSADRAHTTTPIKHVIVVLAENSSFDHTFGTFRPRNGQSIANLLSRGIVNENGTPGPNFGKAAQFTVTPQPTYYISAPDNAKA